MAVPTEQERDAFLWMQGRMVELLLRHDVQRFAATFGEQTADELTHPLQVMQLADRDVSQIKR